MTPWPGMASKLRYCTQGQAARLRAFDDRLRQRVLGRFFDGGGQSQHLALIPIGQQHHIGERRLADGDRAGLVEDHGVELGRALQRVAGADQDAVLRAQADAGRQAHRRRHAQRARAGDDQRRHRHDQRIGQRGAGAKVVPDDEAHDRQDHHRRGEVGRDLVHDALDRHLAALRVLHQPDDLASAVSLPTLVARNLNDPGLVDRCADHLVADLLRDGQRLAGDHALVHRRLAFDDHAVHRDLLARPDDHDVADQHFLDRDVHLAPVADDPRGLGLQADQLLDRLDVRPLAFSSIASPSTTSAVTTTVTS